MSLYPSLEDLKVGQLIQAQASQVIPSQAPAAIMAPQAHQGLYPSLAEISNYMGLSLTHEEIQLNMSLVPANDNALAIAHTQAGPLVAPVTGNDIGLRRSEIKCGIREMILCKDENGKVGLRLRSVDKGIFVQLVQANSPASLVGLRFGDQILQIDGENCAGWTSDRAHKALKRANQDRFSLIVRDRPFERTVTLQKDHKGHVGFIQKKGQITALVKDGSAARNGLLTNHHLCEINGQNVIGLKEHQIAEVLLNCGQTVTVTVIPSVIYEHIVKRMAGDLIKNVMDHSIPEV